MRYLPYAQMLSGFEAMTNREGPQERLQVRDLSVGFGSRVVQRELNFSVHQGSIFAIMGGSGCGKSTVLKAMIRVAPPDDRDSFGGRRRLLGCQRNAPAGNRTPVWRPVSGRRALEFA